METLLVVEHNSRVKPHGPSPSKSFRGINCRTFQSGSGILPTPPCSTSPVSKKPCSFAYSPKTPTPSAVSKFASKSKSHSDNKAMCRNNVRTNPIPINARNLRKEKPLSFSELWAGPAYSNSPPPSSLPIPKFSVRPKRTVSLELASSVSAIGMHPIAKSAPPSPTREHSSSKRDFFHNADPAATKTICRMLNLNIGDDE